MCIYIYIYTHVCIYVCATVTHCARCCRPPGEALALRRMNEQSELITSLMIIVIIISIIIISSSSSNNNNNNNNNSNSNDNSAFLSERRAASWRAAQGPRGNGPGGAGGWPSPRAWQERAPLGCSVASCSGISLFSGSFQSIVTCPVNFYWNCPMDFQSIFQWIFTCVISGVNLLP